MSDPFDKVDHWLAMRAKEEPKNDKNFEVWVDALRRDFEEKA